MSHGLKRLAVVIGNSEYQNLVNIPNAANDAKAIQETLISLGFEVKFGVNPERKEIFDLFDNIRDSWKDEANEIVFYYSGHGISVDGKVYLGSVEAKTDTDFIDENFLDVEKIIKFLLKHRKDDKYPIIIILDCCRSAIEAERIRGYDQDPFRGIKRDNNIKMTNVAISYSTTDGQVAQDGNESDGHSPYTKLLLENIKKNYSIDEINSEIAKSLGHSNQVPWIYHSLHEPYKFCLTKSSAIPPELSVALIIISDTVKKRFYGVPRNNNYFIGRPKLLEEIEAALNETLQRNFG